MPQSDIQRLREQIALEIQAMHNGFQGMAIGIAKHQFIEVRARNLGQLEDQLATHIGEEQAAAFTCQTYIQLTTESEGTGHRA